MAQWSLWSSHSRLFVSMLLTGLGRFSVSAIYSGSRPPCPYGRASQFSNERGESNAHSSCSTPRRIEKHFVRIASPVSSRFDRRGRSASCERSHPLRLVDHGTKNLRV